MSEPLEQVVESVAASRRYRHVCADTVRRLSRDALASSSGDVAAAAKRTKRALHQAFGAFLPAAPRYARWLARLEQEVAAHGPDAEPVRALLRRILALHASTRERLPELERLAALLAARWGRPRRVLDVGCGLAPLAAPWLGLAPDAVYAGVEIDRALVDFLRAALDLLGVRHDLAVADLLDAPELPAADVALALKLVPTLEQQRAGSAADVLLGLPAPLLVTSLPRRALGGRGKALERAWAPDLEARLAREGLLPERLELADELVYVVRRPS